MIIEASFWERALPVFLESTVFWLYLNYVGLAVRTILETPLLPTSQWEPVQKLFATSFLVDYFWRKFLAVGNVIDCGNPLIAIAQRKSRGNFWPIFVSCILSGIVAYFVSEAISPVGYAHYHRHRGLLFCFLIELGFDFVHQARHAAWSVVEARFKRLARLETKLATTRALQQSTKPKVIPDQRGDKTSVLQDSSVEGNIDERKMAAVAPSPSLLTIKARGVHATASFITASIVAFGSYFSTGGPMLNLTYTVMAALAHRDWSLLIVLGTANLLSAYLAGLYVKIDIQTTSIEDIVDVPKGMLSPSFADQLIPDDDEFQELEEDQRKESKKTK